MISIEVIEIIIMSIGGFLFALGGTQISPDIPGQLWLRRILLPVIWGVLVYFFGKAPFWKCLTLTAGTMWAFQLPYGSEVSWPMKFLVGVAYILPTIPLGLTWWQVIMPVSFITMFYLSNTPQFASIFQWGIVETLIGTLVGVTIAVLI
ncbi:MAG: hypothetical protein HYS56_04500 [Candidatus Omnitrophica bacterium]|nr:hypothetical protein [Candidatus Omnitrophota bacterium]